MKNSAGREIAVPANHIAPGDVIEYHTTYTNTTAQPVNDINAMVSLPSGVKLVSLNSPTTNACDHGRRQLSNHSASWQYRRYPRELLWSQMELGKS